MDRLQRLLDIEALRALRAAYFHRLDHKLWDDWIGLFTEDAVLKVDLHEGWLSAGAPPFRIYEGAKVIVDFVSNRLRHARTVHHGHTHEFTFLSDDEATGLWAMEDIVDYGDEGLVHGFGYYRDTYRRVGEDWKFSSVHLTRLRLDLTPPVSASGPPRVP